MRIIVLGPSIGWHADQLRLAALRRGDTISFAAYEELSVAVNSGASLGDPQWSATSGHAVLSEADVVLARTIPWGTLDQITFRLAVLHAMKDQGIRVVNPPRTLEIAIDKLATLIAAQREGWRVPKTIVCQSRVEGLEAFDRLGGDVVIKPTLGSEGRGVMRVHDKDLAWTTLTALERLGAVLYLQQFVPPGGRDLRILVWGKDLFAIRRSNPRDWRTNVSRGASCENVPVPQQMVDPLRRLAEKLGLLYGAIDFVEDEHGEPLLLEVNAVPGWQGSQRTLSKNLAELLLELCHNGA